MISIFKKEMKLFFTHARSYVLLGVMLALSSVSFVLFNLIYANISLVNTLVYTGYSCIVAVPFLALWMFLREDRAAGELFLFSLPITPTGICLGKFLALFSQCALGCAPLIIYPLILKPHGDFDVLFAYLCVLLFLAVLMLICAICFFVFSAIRNKLAATLVALFGGILCIGVGVLYDLLPVTPLCALIGAPVLFALVALGVILVSRRYVAGAVIFALGVAVYAFDEISFSHLLLLISPFDRLNAAYFGLFDLAGLIFTLCLAAIFIFAAVLLWHSRQRMEDKSVRFFSSKPHKVFAAVIVGTIVFNAIFALLPPQVRRISPDTKDMFHVSDESVRFLSELGEGADDVNIYFLTSDGKQDYQVYEFLRRYVAKNPLINLYTVNVNFDDTRVREYLDRGVSEHSIIVKSSKRARVIDYSEMFYFYNWDSVNFIGLGKVSLGEYEDCLKKYPQYFEMIPTVFCFDGDALLTNAINYVTSDSVPVFYLLQGHGEAVLSEIAQAYLTSSNCDVKYVDISSMDALPDDCDTLIINAPQKDVSESELAVISSYLDRGGRLFIDKSYSLKLKNLDALLASRGVSQREGLVCEGDDSKYVNQSPNVFPNYIIGTPLDHPITSPLASDAYMMFMNAADIAVSDTLPEGVTVEPLFVTSEISYRQLSDNKDDISEKGTCTLGVAIEAKKSDGVSSKIVFFACENVLNDAATSLTSGGNLLYAKSALSWLSEKGEGTLAVSARLVSGTLAVSRITLIVWSILLVIVLPTAVISTGFVSRYKRRKK